MNVLINQLPPWLIVGAITLAAGFVAYLVTRSLKEGREISFWPPRIGPKVSDDKENKSGVVAPPPPGPTPIISYQCVNVPSEPIGMIRVTSGPSYGLTIFLTKQTRKLSFGRSHTDVTSVEINDTLMSIRHFVIKVTTTNENIGDATRHQIELLDLASTNGTFVNGRRVQMGQLHDGDNIQAGGSSFRVYFLDSVAV